MRIFLIALVIPILCFGMHGGRNGRRVSKAKWGYGSMNQHIVNELRNDSMSTADAPSLLEQEKNGVLGAIDKILRQGEKLEDLKVETKHLKDSQYIFKARPINKKRCCLWRYFCCFLPCCGK